VRILVVEDERPFRDALERVLRNDGYEVELAVDGHAALQALSVRSPDAVVLDVLLPRFYCEACGRTFTETHPGAAVALAGQRSLPSASVRALSRRRRAPGDRPG
jgi:DNA-binding response OmpR family regulator